MTLLNKDYLNFENWTINTSSRHGFEIEDSSNINIMHCNLSYIGGGEHKNLARGVLGNAIEYWVDSVNMVAKYNKISQVYDVALTNQGDSNEVVENITYQYNIVTNSEYCYEFFSNGLGSSIKNILFDHNTCYMTPSVFHQDRLLLNASYVSQTEKSQCFRIAKMRTDQLNMNMDITNNLCFNPLSQLAIISSTGDFVYKKNSNFYLDYNAYFRNLSDVLSLGITIMRYNATNYNTTFAAYQTASLKDINSIYENITLYSKTGYNIVPDDTSYVCNMSSTGYYVGALPCNGDPATTTTTTTITTTVTSATTTTTTLVPAITVSLCSGVVKLQYNVTFNRTEVVSPSVPKCIDASYQSSTVCLATIYNTGLGTGNFTMRGVTYNKAWYDQCSISYGSGWKNIYATNYTLMKASMIAGDDSSIWCRRCYTTKAVASSTNGGYYFKIE